MARVEELPDNFDESLHTSSSADGTPQISSRDELRPSLPPGADSIRSHTAEDIVKMMGRSPLFMTSLEDTVGEGLQKLLVLVDICSHYS